MAGSFDPYSGYGQINARNALALDPVLQSRIFGPAKGAVAQSLVTFCGIATGVNFARYTLDSDVMKSNRMYVTCQVDEDLPYIVRVAGEDNLMIGSDYTHRDQSMEFEFPRLLRERAGRGEISPSAVQKILYDNAKTFYGL